MVLVYQGDYERLAEEVREHKPALDKAYWRVLGLKETAKLERVANRILTPDCFFSNPDKINTRLERECATHTSPSRFLFLTDYDSETDKTGRIKNRKASVSGAFYVSESSLKHSSYDTPISTFVHEFNHFVPVAIQRTPIYLALQYLSSKTGQIRSPDDLLSLVRRLKKEKIPKHEKATRVYLGMHNLMLYDMWEKATRVLDKLIQASIGINIPLPWRGKPKEIMTIKPSDLKEHLAFRVAGDPFIGLSDMEVVRRIMDWENYFNPIEFRNNGSNKIPHARTFFESLKGVSVEKLALPDFIEKVENS